MQIQVLGTVDVLEPAGVAVGGPTQRRVLSALLLQPNQVVSIDQLVDCVWPHDGAPERAEHNVRTYVHRLRTALGEAGDRIETVGTGYRLRVEPDELDSRKFEDLVSQARELAGGGDAESARWLLDEALALWRGRPFDEFADEEWARTEVARLGEIRASAVEHRFAAMLDAGRHTEVVGALREAVTDEPWREARQMQLALALYRSGRQAEALRAIQRYKSELADEIGLVPSANLDELEHKILDHDPILLAPPHRQHVVRDYQLDEVIGEGAFSLVWRGVQPSLDRKVAIKQIRAELANQPDFVRRFETEAQTVAALEHPHIVPLYDYWREPDSAFLVMRYVAGGSLESEVLARGLDEPSLRRLVEQVGSALHTAHRAGVIHRDVKSANVLVDGDGNYYLTDFGIAFTGTAASDELATALSTGSPAYASPEQLLREPLDNRTDVYGFGITLFEAATGRLPFIDAPTQAALIDRQLNDAVPAPSSVGTGVPAWVDQIVARATAKNKADRFASMAELVAAMPESGARLDDHGHRVEAAPPIGDLVNPFKALSAFRESDAADFYGRDRLIARFVDVLERPGSAGRLLAVVGPSGSGKSSAVRSGLLPILRAGGVSGSADWFITTMMPGRHPFDELESALSRVAVRQPGPLVEIMRDDDRGIARAIGQTLPDADSELLLVIDQFEEVFTHTSQAERTQFLDGLLAAVHDPRTRLRVVLTIRADFLGGPLRHAQLAARLETAMVTVSPLAADELEAAIVEPVRRQGAGYESGLVARIMADVGDQPGALPLLQYALTELFDANDAGLLKAESYDAIGGLAGALATRADDILTAMTIDQQAVARRLFGRLVTLGDGTEDTRRRVKRRELGEHPDMLTVIDVFGAARLLVFDHDPATREPTVEVAHEMLLQAWPRLRTWLDDDREDLRTLNGVGAATESWIASDRDEGELARGGRLEIISDLADRRAETLNDAESEWVRASQAAAVAAEQARTDAAERDRRQNRRLRAMLVAAAVFVVIAVIAAGVAVVQRNRAADSERVAAASQGAALSAQAEALAADEVASAAATAEAAAETSAQVDRLMGLSSKQIQTQPDVAALLALEANRRRDDIGTQSAIQTVLANLRGVSNVFPNPLGENTSTQFSDDGTLGITWSFDSGTFVWFDPTTGEPVGEPYIVGEMLAALASGDGSVIAYVLADDRDRITVARRNGDEMSTVLAVDGELWAWALDHSGETLAFVPAGSSGYTQILDVGSGRVISEFPTPEGAVRILLDDEGQYAVVWWQTDTNTAGFDVIDVETGELRERFPLAGFVTGGAVAADDRIVTGFFDGSLSVTTLSTPLRPAVEQRFPAHVGAIDLIKSLPSGMIVTYGRDRSVRFWSDNGERQRVPPLLNQPGVTAMGVDATGITLTQSSGRMVRLDLSSRLALPIVEAEIREGGRFGYQPGSPWWNSNPVGDQTVLRFTRLDGDEQRDIDVRSVHPTGWHGTQFSSDGQWLRTSDADRTSGLVGIWEISGDRRAVVHLAPLWDELGIEFPNPRMWLADGGEQLFMIDRRNDSDVAVWIDVASEQVVAGPLDLEDVWGTLVLRDNSVVVGAGGPLRVLAPGLDRAPTIVADSDGLQPFHQDPTSGLVLLMGQHGEVALFDPDSGEIEHLAPVPGPAQGGAFSPSGDRIAITSVAGGVQLYDVATGQQIGTPMVSDGFGVGADPTLGGYGVAWSADGRGVWAVSLEGPVRYAAHPDSWRDIACGIAGRELTAEEWRTYVSDSEPQVSVCT